MAVSVDGGALHVAAPGFHFVHGAALERLKNGQSVQFEFDLMVFAGPGGPVTAQSRRRFNMSYDLWEERFAVAAIEAPSRSVSHLTQAAVERWCLEQLAVPSSALSALARDAPFWIRLAYRVANGSEEGPGDDGTFTLVGLIDRLSRRRATGDLEDSVDAGPFRLSD